MKRLTEYSVASGFRIAWRLATWPTMRCPSSVNATTDGVVRLPSALGMTSALPPSMTAATTELVVPRSIPTAFAMTFSSVPGSGFVTGPRSGTAGARRLGAATTAGRAPGPGVKPAPELGRSAGAARLDGMRAGPTATAVHRSSTERSRHDDDGAVRAMAARRQPLHRRTERPGGVHSAGRRHRHGPRRHDPHGRARPDDRRPRDRPRERHAHRARRAARPVPGGGQRRAARLAPHRAAL